tara:strand:- start:285 stop:599 length:315 start_codon:yes stop_codon:yes gene_type:complete
MRAFHNTTNEVGAKLAQSTSKALTQDECVLAYFKERDELGATPERVLRHFKIMEKLSSNRWSNTPITSIRRSFSTLKKRGLIYKTDLMIMGDYGKEIHVWKLVR